MDYKGDLVLREIPYGKIRTKWSYDVIIDKNNIHSEGDVLPSRVVLRYIMNGITVELVDESNNHLCLLARQ